MPISRRRFFTGLMAGGGLASTIMGGPQAPATSAPEADAVREAVGSHDTAAESVEREMAADTTSGPEVADDPGSGEE